MKLILKIKNNKPFKNKKIIAWIPKNSAFNNDIQQIFQFFKDKIKISKLSRFLRYYVVSSENPAIMLSLFSSIQDLIPDICFNTENLIEKEDFDYI